MSPQHPHDQSAGGLSRRRMLQLIGAGAGVPLLGGALSSCSSGEDGLVFVYRGDADQQEAFNSLFEEFNEVEPEIELAAQGIAADDWGAFSNTVATRIAGGQVPDIIQVATEGQRIFASRDLLEPLEELMDADAGIVDDYFADLDENLAEWNTTYASHDGRPYYIPGGYNTVCLWLNKATFEAAGVAVPDEAWSWDEFYDAAEQFRDAGVFILPFSADYFTGVMPWLLTNGASTFDEDWAVPTFNSDAAIEAAQFCRTMVEEGFSPEPGGQFDAAEALNDGSLACIAGGRWPVLDMRRLDLVEQMKIVPMPQQADYGSPVGWDAWPITRESEQKEDAWTFIKFLMSSEASTFYARAGGTIVPARPSVAQSADFLENAPEGSEHLSEAISYATPIPSPDRGAESQTAIQEAWEQVLTGRADAADALNSANAELEELL